MAFYVIKESFDLTDYGGVTCNEWDKPPSIDAIKSDISGQTVKFEVVDVDYSAPVASELEISETLIDGGEKASVTNVIVAKVTKYVLDGETNYNREYWRSRA